MRNTVPVVPQRNARALPERLADPARVEQVTLHLVFAHLPGQHLGVGLRRQRQKRRAETRREGRHRIPAEVGFRAGQRRRVAGHEMVHRMGGTQARHGRQHAKRVASQKHDGPRMAAQAAGNCVGYVVQRIGTAGVLGDRIVKVIRLARDRVHHHVLDHRAEANRVPDQRLAFLGEFDALGVTAAFEVEHALVAPAVLVVADQAAVRVGRERRLARAAQAEKQRHVAVFADVGRAMHRQHALKRQHVV